MHNPLRRLMRAFMHVLIISYLYRVGGALHDGPYGPRGLYVVVMNEQQYHDFRERVAWPRWVSSGDIHFNFTDLESKESQP